MTTNKLIVPAALFFGGTLVLSVTLVWYGTRTSSVAPAPYYGDQASASSLAEAKAYISKLPVLRTPVYGIVSATGADTITLTETSAGRGPYTFSVSSNTDIYNRGGQKDKAAFQKEIDAFTKYSKEAGADSATTYLAPDSLMHTPIKLSDIKAGQSVRVVPADDSAGAKRSAQIVETGELGF